MLNAMCAEFDRTVDPTRWAERGQTPPTVLVSYTDAESVVSEPSGTAAVATTATAAAGKVQPDRQWRRTVVARLVALDVFGFASHSSGNVLH